MKIDFLQNFSKQIKKNILFAAYNAGVKSAHIGGALSISDILAVLYGAVIKIDSKDANNIERDRFILSKGHACLALYSALVEKKFFSRQELCEFENDDSFLLGHPVINKQYGIEFSTGSLGMGISLGIGTALAAKLKKLKYKTYVILGDGECNEGSVWEAVMSASHFKLDNLIVILDKNNLQQTGETKSIMNLNDYTKKFSSFGWEVREINGHDIEQIYNSLILKNSSTKPLIIIAETIKGKGISFFENDNAWHHSILSKSNYEKALAEID